MTKKKKNKSNNNSSRDTQSSTHSCQPTNNNYTTSKKRKRSPTKEDDEQFNIDNNSAMDESIVPHVISWLQKRKKKVPDALLKSSDNTSFSNMDSILQLLPSLRERERRALIRHIDKSTNNKDGGTNSDKKEVEGSDGEYDIHDDKKDVSSKQNSEWPSNVTFSNNYQWDASVPNGIKDKYSPPNAIRQRAPRLSNKVYFKRITDQNHPAYGEFGLYCALSHAKPGSWLLDYVGHITLGEDQDKTSDYVSDFGEKSELACDANNYGNEARFLNDFRNTGRHPNVEFNTRRDKHGELRQGVFVKLTKDAREDGFDGVRKDEELLVSYGKSYWRSRVGNLTDFIWRLPGQPMPKEGKPPNQQNS